MESSRSNVKLAEEASAKRQRLDISNSDVSESSQESGPSTSGNAPMLPKESCEDLRKTQPRNIFKLNACFEACPSIIWGCAFNNYRKFPANQLLAMAAGKTLQVYEFPTDDKSIRLDAKIKLNLKTPDEFYAVAWCLQTSAVNGSKSSKIVTGGETGKLYVIDYETKQLDRELTGCTKNINDIQTSPMIKTQIVVGSQDGIVRIYDIRSTSPLFASNTLNGHNDMVLSVAWTRFAKGLVSAGYDRNVIIWDLTAPDVRQHLEKATNKLDQGSDHVIKTKDLTYQKRKLTDFHSNYIDCVSAIHSEKADTTYFITKACGYTPEMKLWRLGGLSADKETTDTSQPPARFTTLKEFKIHDKEFPYFMKFGVDDARKLLIVGGWKDIQVFDFTSSEPIQKIKCKGGLVRQIAFCQGKHFFAAVTEEGTICRYDPRDDGANKNQRKRKPNQSEQSTSAN